MDKLNASITPQATEYPNHNGYPSSGRFGISVVSLQLVSLVSMRCPDSKAVLGMLSFFKNFYLEIKGRRSPMGQVNLIVCRADLTAIYHTRTIQNAHAAPRKAIGLLYRVYARPFVHNFHLLIPPHRVAEPYEVSFTRRSYMLLTRNAHYPTMVAMIVMVMVMVTVVNVERDGGRAAGKGCCPYRRISDLLNSVIISQSFDRQAAGQAFSKVVFGHASHASHAHKIYTNKSLQ